jgi:transposase
VPKARLHVEWRRPSQRSLDDFRERLGGSEVTITLPSDKSTVQTRSPSGFASNSLATPSGIVTRSESDPSRTLCIDERNSAGKAGSQEEKADQLLSDCQPVGESIADTLKYLADYRQLIAYARGEGTGLKMQMVPPDFGSEIDELRWAKGRAILSNPHCVRQERADLFFVKSQSSPGSYAIRLAPGRMECECADYMERRLPCKHIAAVRLYLEKWKGAHPMPTHDLAPAPERVLRGTYPQNWAAYDRGQMEEVRLFELLLADLLADVPDVERGMGRPRVPRREGLFCAIQKVYSQLSCRRSHSLMGFAVARGQLNRTHGFVLSSRVLNDEGVTPILHEMITQSALPLAGLEQGFAQDSTGIQTSSFGAWRAEKHREVRTHHWIKAHALVGVKTHVVARVSVTDKDGGDNPEFERLIREVAERGVKLKEVYADKAYSARVNYALAEKVGFELYVPFRAGSRANPTGHGRLGHDRRELHSRLWNKAFHYFQLHRDEFEAKYHQRSNVESVFSALKRKFGETLRSKTRTAQVNELLAKILAYNLTVLIHEIFEHGVMPEFLKGAEEAGLPRVEIGSGVSDVPGREA